MLVYYLTSRHKFLMGSLAVKKANRYAFDLRFAHSSFLWPWRGWRALFLALAFGFRVILKNPIQKIRVIFNLPQNLRTSFSPVVLLILRKIFQNCFRADFPQLQIIGQNLMNICESNSTVPRLLWPSTDKVLNCGSIFIGSGS